jgi:integrase
MPRRSSGPRLWLKPGEVDKKSGKVKKYPVWYIKDDGYRGSTGFPEDDRAGAEKALAEYIAAKHRPEREQDRPSSKIHVTDVLAVYAQDVAVNHAKPHKTAERLLQLSEWWGDKMLSEVNGRSCREYVEWRKKQAWKSARPDKTGRQARTVGNGGARRELEDLRAAVNHYRREGYCRELIDVILPPKGEPRDRFLTRSEAAQLLWHMWRYREPQTIHRGPRAGEVIRGGKKKRQHLARFLLVGIYTGTRAAAICSAAFDNKPGQSWVDLETGLYHRLAVGKKKTNKRQPPVRLPDRLIAHMTRWRDKGKSREYVVEYHENLRKPVGEVNKGFASAVRDAGLPDDVTPHVLRHTCATWLMQRGASPWDAAHYLGMTEKMLQEVYGHWHPDYQAGIAGGRVKGAPPPGLYDIFSVHYHPERKRKAKPKLALVA